MAFETINIPIARDGINKDVEPTSLQGIFSPNMKNMVLTKGGAKKRDGYSILGDGLPLKGTGMMLVEYVDDRNTTHYIAVTTSNVYKYNTSTTNWDYITPTTLLEGCESGWTGGTSVTLAHDAVDYKVGSKSAKLTLTAQRTNGDLLAYKDISSVDASARTEIGFWIKSSIALAASALEVVVSESNHASGEKTGTFVESLSTALTADTWTYVQLTKTLTDFNAVISVSIFANATIASGAVIRLDHIGADKIFVGNEDNEFTFTISHDANYFSNNGGTALIISNGVDDFAYFEGQSGDKFQYAGDSGSAGFGFPSFGNAKEIANLWDHFFLLNYNNGNNNIRGVAFAGFANIDDHTSSSAGLTTITDSIGKIVRGKKLGGELVIYSSRSITTAMYLGGTILFSFPTLVLEAGLFSYGGVWDFVNVHYFMSSDLKIYAYAGGTHLIPVGQQIEDDLFSNLNSSKKDRVVSGVNLREHLLYFLYPRASDDYAKVSYAMNYKLANLPWTYFEFNDTIRSLSIFESYADWYCDDTNAWFGTTQFKNIYVDEVKFTCDDSYTQIGFPVPTFLSHDGYVFRMDGINNNDNGTDIECVYDTEDITIDKEEHFARFSWYSFNAKADVADSTVQVFYSADGGEVWIEADDSPVTLTSKWLTYRIPIDSVSRKMRFRLLQNSNKDLQIRDNMHCSAQLETERD